MIVVKKDGTCENFDKVKIINAVKKSAGRVPCTLSDTDYELICDKVISEIHSKGMENEKIPVSFIHSVVEHILLNTFEDVGLQYQQYRNYKLDFVRMMDKVYEKSQSVRYIGDVSNANSDSSMVSTQRSIIYGELNKALYKKFFLNKEELQASNDGFIYIHDMKDRLDCVNCMLFDMGKVIKSGFEMGNIWYNEPKTIDTAFDVISDVTLSAASQEYGGFTIPQIDKILAPYAKKSYEKYFEEYKTNFSELCDAGIVDYSSESGSFDFDELNLLASEYAVRKLERDVEQGFQGLEYKFNSVSSSRGDYPFTSISFGIGTDPFETLISKWALRVRRNGQGKDGFKKPVLFPKLTFLYDEELHGEGKRFEWLFDEAIECSKQAMYPDFLSLSGTGYIPSMYKKYEQVVSLMGRVAAHVKLCELFA